MRDWIELVDLLLFHHVVHFVTRECTFHTREYDINNALNVAFWNSLFVHAPTSFKR